MRPFFGGILSQKDIFLLLELLSFRSRKNGSFDERRTENENSLCVSIQKIIFEKKKETFMAHKNDLMKVENGKFSLKLREKMCFLRKKTLPKMGEKSALP